MKTFNNWLLIGAIASSFALAACDRSPPPQTQAAAAADDVPVVPAPVDQSVPPAVDQSPPAVASAPADVAAPVASIAERRTPARAATPRVAEPAYARVVSVKPVRDDRSGSHQECRDVEVTRQAPVKDQNRVAGTAIGAVVGGVVGHQVGGGRGRDLATVAGAVGGGIAGRKIQENQQNRRTVTSVEQRCTTVKDQAGNGAIIAYDIVYEYGGQSHTARIDHDPGDRIALPVRPVE